MYYHNQKPKQKLAQKMLALYVTQDIHGKTRAHHAKEITEILFESTKPLTELTMEQFELLLRELPVFDNQGQKRQLIDLLAVSYTHLTLPTTCNLCRSRWSPYH